MSVWLSQDALRRVLQSLMTATWRAQAPRVSIPATPWPDDLLLGEEGATCLGCDSLDLLQLSTAVNEMFHLHEAHLEAELLQRSTFGEWIALVQEAWRRGVQSLTLTTSGSSGRPKPCTHSVAALNLEIDYLTTLFATIRRVVAFTPAHHLYGLLFTAMLPDRLHVPVVDLQSPAASTDESATLQQGDLIVTFPEGWRWIDQNIGAVPPAVEGVVSTAPCPRDLIASLMDAKLSGFTEVYGSSETSGIGTRRWPSTAYTLMPQWQRSAAVSSSGEVMLQHQMGFEVEPMDHLEFLDDRTFLLQGRKDLGVQVAGTNVFPATIAEKLKTHPGVAEAAVRLMRPEEGQRLKCFIVPRESQSEQLEKSLRDWVDTWPTVAERPKAFTFGAALPRNALGKATDW